MRLLDCGCGPGTNTVLSHLKDPPLALQEVYGVLKQSGVIGVQDADHGSWLGRPANPEGDGCRLHSLGTASRCVLVCCLL
jgi:hypothetical protein